ncbi:hypothetical protein CJ305_09810 [Leeuwenhoekiella nanhaiensis]|uniref:FAS1 domain-containing protein n=2 Tax=Leeuwenhoekiella nanhaiensis TaxID=1655491 RepID=A0A2G1VS43_9FLAO|nr:hypothetical protein CJ305_09810 [Leeuwenhoekiella nanhaiensis]
MALFTNKNLLNINPTRMISIKLNKHYLGLGLLLLGLVSCSEPWEDHAGVNDSNLTLNLNEAISQNSQTSEFGKLLAETGYDRILAASKTYTVFAPTNEALAAVDAPALSSAQAKKLFVANHVALTAFTSVSQQDTVSIEMYSNKYLQFIDGNRIADAQVVDADNYTSNGLYHIIDKGLAPRRNIWEFIKDQAATNDMSAYLMELNAFNLYPRDSVAKANAMPGMQADSLSNSYFTNVYNLNNEKNKYTFFLLDNESFTEETDRLKPYMNRVSEDSTTIYTNYFTTRDLAFHKAIARENLPDTLVSKFGVKVPLTEATIAEEIQLSNGVVYVMSKLEVPLETRLLTTTIQGENPFGFSQSDKRANTFYREKADPQGDVFFDIMVQNHRVPRFTIYYNASNLYTTTYQVYWRAINDIQSNTFQQRVSFGGFISPTDGSLQQPFAELPYTNVEPNTYEEVYIGEFTLDQKGRDALLVSLQAANSATDGVNTLTLDYLKLVPVIK